MMRKRGIKYEIAGVIEDLLEDAWRLVHKSRRPKCQRLNLHMVNYPDMPMPKLHYTAFVSLSPFSGVEIMSHPYSRVRVYSISRAQFMVVRKHRTWRGSPRRG